MRLKVKNETHLYRDMDSRAIINSDIDSYNKYKESKRRIAEQKDEIQNYKSELMELKDELASLKESMSQIIARLNSKE